MCELKKVVEPAEFGDFFRLLNGGHAPFTWQSELLELILRDQRWPDRLVVPTGGGKSSVVDIHLFANACAQGLGIRIPRRLHLVVNRRALVDGQAVRAEMILSRLKASTPESDELLWRVSESLKTLRVAPDSGPFELGHLRGELSNRTLPVDDLSACAVIAATPDMWGSRLLFRGYGSSRFARPRETTLVAMDSVLILDEAHLNRQLLFTARTVAKLQRREIPTGIPSLQVVETTATSPQEETGELVTVGVSPDELSPSGPDVLLRKRLNAHKKLVLKPLQGWNGRPANSMVVNAAVDEATRLHSTYGATTGCMVNHVDTATNIARALRKRGLAVKLLVGRMRPYDVEQLRQTHPDLLTPRGDDSVDIVVATQTLEVGIDANFRGLVTELAPGAALAQRLGRLNRLGDFEQSEAVILTPPSPDVIKTEHPPYRGDDLAAALHWLHQVAEEGSLNPATINKIAAPAESPRRDLFQRVELTDLDLFSKTSQKLFAEPDLGLWLRDSFEQDVTMGGVVVRENLPQDDPTALELLKALPPRDEEAFPASLSILQMISEELVVTPAHRFKMELKSQGRRKTPLLRRVFLFRENEVSLMTTEDTLRPGDILVIDRGLPFTTENVATMKPQDPPPTEVPLKGELRVFNPHLSRLDQQAFEKLVGMTSDEVAELYSDGIEEVEVTISATIIETGGREVVPWFFVIKKDVASPDEEALQEWTTSKRRVLLSDHQQAVGLRARKMCSLLDLKPELIDAVTLAAEHHDEGKRDPRFQRMLGASGIDEVLAKSESRTVSQVRKARSESGLPSSWRHEQLSALFFATRSDALIPLRIIGTSHGHGRPDFPHVGDDLLDNPEHSLRDLAAELFTTGKWDSIITTTHRDIGYYTMAMFEAFERAADAQVSREGR